MSESALDKLRREANERGFERKVEAIKKEQVEREGVKQVHLIGAIYIELVASREPTKEEIKIFEEEKKSRVLEEELEVALKFFRKTTTSTTTTKPQVIVISNSNLEVEIISQPTVEEKTPQALESRPIEEEVEL
jgi:hypothetical protein